MSIPPYSPFSPTPPSIPKEEKKIEHIPKSYSEQFYWALKGEEMEKETLSLENAQKKI